MKKTWKCEVCGRYVAKKDRISKRYCSIGCKRSAKKRICEICGTEFQAYLDSQRFCGECSGSSEAKRIYYNEKLLEKECIKCKELFTGTQKATLCPKCYEENRKRTMVHIYETITRPVICKQCEEIVSYEEVKDSYRTLSTKRGNAYCDYCRNKRARERKERAEKRKERKRIERKKKRRNTPRKKMSEESRKRLSERMKRNNPMFDRKIRQKVSKTIRRGYETGRISVPAGQNNPLWKGNRSFNLTVRRRLYGVWIRPILERDGFLCTMCGAGGQLQVHHLRPLRDIIDTVGHRVGIDKFDNYRDDPRYDEYIQMVVDEHKLSDGITLCKKCHAKIDGRYRVKCE